MLCNHQPIANDTMYNSRVARPSGESSDVGLGSLPTYDTVEGHDDRLAECRREGTNLGCDTCPRLETAKNLDHESDFMIYLHALEYRGEKWKYEAHIPAWAEGFPGTNLRNTIARMSSLDEMMDVGRTSTRNSQTWGPSSCSLQ